MVNKLQVLLIELKITDQVNVLADGNLDRTFITTDNRFDFYLSLPRYLPFEEYQLLLTSASNFQYPCTFDIYYEKLTIDQDDIAKYIEYIIQLINQSGTAHISLQPSNFTITDKIRIEVCNEIQLQLCVGVTKQFSQLFASMGFDLPVEFYIDEENEVFKTIQEEMNQYKPVEIDISTIPAPSYEAPKTNTYNKDYSFSNKAISLRLNEIDITTRESQVDVKGFVFKTDLTKIKSGKHIQTLYITDYTDSIIVKRFENKNSNTLEDMKALGKGNVWVRVQGQVKHDDYARDDVIIARKIEIANGPNKRMDQAKEKRVELHTHSKMSTMDGISTISQYINTAAAWGHKSIAITDHGNVQSFPEAQSACKSHGMKMIYGIEMYMYEPKFETVFNPVDRSIEHATYVSFDLETTGFSFYHDGITEFGAVKIRNGEVIDRLQSFINPEKQISMKITNLTSITNEMVQDAPTIKEFLPTILEFFDDCILVAHNAKFDIGFLNENLTRIGKDTITNPVIDSLALSRVLLKPIKNYRLGTVCRQFKVAYDDEVAHRADYDAEVLGNVFTAMLYQMMQTGKYNLLDISSLQHPNADKFIFPSHITVLAKNRVGLKNMFKAVSESNTLYFHKQAQIPKERLSFYREGLLFGSSCYRGDVFDTALYGTDEKLKEVIAFYDYIEIQPLEDYDHLINRGKIDSREEIIISIQRIITEAKKQNKMIVATGDVHFLNPNDQVFRDIFIAKPDIGINRTAHPLCDRKNPKAPNPNQYFRTTDEMLECYPYLSKEDAYEYVVTNTNLIADMIEPINPVHDKLFTPHIDGADEELRAICYQTAHDTYGEKLPKIVEERLERELGNIIKHGFGVIYYISHKLVKKSNDDGYLVGSRGSVGSSFVATMSGITEVNPLPPHYICRSCKYSEFVEEGFIANGYDLETKACPVCGEPLIGDGHNIPFETFLGFEADKVPDIDLNFSGAYQSKAHDYTKVLFGEEYVYRAGTIATVAEKTAYGFVKGYSELVGSSEGMRGAEIERIAGGCQGVKRTTGQHPGGIIVIPSDMDVYDFTPVQFPADDLNSSWKTTHFDFHAIHDNVLKLDILGHVDPTVIRALQDLTHVDPKTIPTNDKKVLSLFLNTHAMNIDLSFINCKTGALGLPEFGTSFVRGMLEQTKPTSFNDLVIISGLSHGTDVYLGNAETLIKDGTCTLSQVIGCRDDIMVYLIEKGLPNKDAFDIMEVVRKGKSSAVFPQKKYEELMKKHNVPQWYIDSCKKIKYMFPKAHAAAYVLSAIRVAWWKLYYPREYYCVYFSTRCDFYEIETLIQGKDAILNRREEILELKAQKAASNKEEALYDTFDIALEMIERGYRFKPVNLELSLADKFTLDPNDEFGIIPPFSSIDALGVNVATTIIDARNQRPFISKEDVTKRTKLNNTHIRSLEKMGVFKGMQEANQLSLF